MPNKTPSTRSKTALLIILILVVGVLMGLGYCMRNSLFRRQPRHNVILIIIDTLRSDRLGCSGNSAGMTPQIDKFARRAVRFDQAYAHAPWTLPSVASLFTSNYPIQHGAGGHLGAFTLLPDSAVTIAEVFKDAGAFTGAITNVLFLTEKFGMTQGFDTIDSHIPQANTLMRPAGATTAAALKWLDQHRSKPFFLFIHYFDPHLTYDPPQPFRQRFAAAEDAGRADYIFGTVDDMIKLRNGQVNLDSQTITRLEKLHNGEVAYTDAEVGALLAGISARRLDDNTIVVITSDHGEEFLEHGGFEHGHTLYDELLHIPLLIRVPLIKLPPPLAVPTTVRHIDLAPTLCELAGIEPNPAFMGQSFVSLMQGEKEKDRPILSQGNMWGPSQSAWRKDGFKLIYQSSGSAELFDVNADAAEQNNLAEKSAKLRDSMMSDLQLILRSVSRTAKTHQAPTLSQDDIDKLRSLGYVK